MRSPSHRPLAGGGAVKAGRIRLKDGDGAFLGDLPTSPEPGPIRRVSRVELPAQFFIVEIEEGIFKNFSDFFDRFAIIGQSEFRQSFN